jgi:hypothetical protein
MLVSSQAANADQFTGEQMSVGSTLANSNRVLLHESKRPEPAGQRGGHYTFTEAMRGLEEADPTLRANTAIMLENTRHWMYEQLNETTRLINVGDFEKYAFQLVRAVFPNLIAHQIVSVQPMMGPTSLVFYQQFLYNTTKGSAVAGRDIHENPNVFYSSEHIDAETIGAAPGVNPTGNLDFRPVRPGTLTITDGTQVITDDGQGNLIGDINPAGANTVDYNTGAFDVTFAAATGADPTAEYDYNMEANDQLPEIDLNLVSAPVVARPRKLRTRWSLEATHDLKSLHGLEAEIELVGATANELKFEIDREIINDLRSVASATSAPAIWGSKTPTGISFTEHKLSFVDTLVRMSNAIYQKTQRAVGTWIVAGIEVCNIIETLPGFKADGTLTGRGVYRVGTLNNRWVVYKDSFLPDNDFLMGYKGEAMFETGMIFAPYIPMYTTPTVMLDDFIARRGIASRYGKKVVNSKFYVNGTIDATLEGPQPLVP